ncbi:hypothetical protein N7474_008645 [Penicillium riverlandense]|uniref:uncharacterized protein n=1 Tax=Penicillium riverlandense TaxID=1903569 RepID=UPI0025483739|nr:uncharacterized protein N7474_008645 [Penicillium riverlandense]KAJ5812344.1 hypothetical protein N7474_008645 [Penicillium riverlandense]
MPAQPDRVFCCDEVDTFTPCSNASAFRLLVNFVEWALKNEVNSSPAQGVQEDYANDTCWQMWGKGTAPRYFQSTGNGFIETHSAPTVDWVIETFPKLQCRRHGKEYFVDMVRIKPEIPQSIRRLKEQRWAPRRSRSDVSPKSQASQSESPFKPTAQIASGSGCTEFANLKNEIDDLRVESIPSLLEDTCSLIEPQPRFGKHEERTKETAEMIKEFKAKVNGAGSSGSSQCVAALKQNFQMISDRVDELEGKLKVTTTIISNLQTKLDDAGSSASAHCIAALNPTLRKISDHLDKFDNNMEDTAGSSYDLKVEVDDARSSASPERIEVLKPLLEIIAPHNGKVDGSKSRLFGAMAFDTMNRILRSVGIDVDVDMPSAWKDCLTPFEIFNLILDCNFTDSVDKTTYDDCVKLADACKSLSLSGFNNRGSLVRVLEELSWQVGDDQDMRLLVARAFECVKKFVQCTEMLNEESQSESEIWTSAVSEAERYDPSVGWEHVDSDGDFAEEGEY